MSSAVDIQIVSPPNLDKIESYFKDASYRETIEYSANFNTRLCVERRLRLPFLDPQTGVAQKHSQLFVNKRQRMPGFRQGQIYTYPAPRWRKSRRQYLSKMYRFPDRPFQALRKEHEALMAGVSTANTIAGIASPTVLAGAPTVLHDADFNGSFLEESSSLGAAGGDTSDSKDSQQQQQLQQQPQQQQQQLKEDLPKEWWSDMDMNDVDSLEEPKSPADDEYDYDPRYGSKKRRKRRAGKRATLTPGEGGGGGRRRSGAYRGRSSAADPSLGVLDTSLDGGSDVSATTSSTGGGRRPRGTGTRGRRRTKANNANACDPPSPGLNSEPPSFESAAAAVGVLGDLVPGVGDEHGDLRNYRKYL